MGSIQAVGSVASPSSTSSTTPNNALSAATSMANGLNADLFMKLFTTQLANQDPMNPMDSSQFLNQFSQITQVQSVAQLTQSMGNFQNIMTSLLNASNASQGEGLLGKQVQYTDSSGNPQTGTVSAMTLAPDGTVKLNIGGNSVGLSSINQIN